MAPATDLAGNPRRAAAVAKACDVGGWQNVWRALGFASLLNGVNFGLGLCLYLGLGLLIGLGLLFGL
ncbi:hypothetical protein ES288_D03G045100v1 [Gossypium darwinii]|uniref:Uncharacterized protein n=1 Tax=Gossypium darwinii TaxID=34276 RepID=A0A5D2D5I1_GOSDA|nr:hypothetical protein ES288_D03G045100v1 [Gossypium darwinii]